MIQIVAKVLDAQAGKFTNDEGQEIVFSNAVIQTDEGVHSVNGAPDVDLKSLVGEKEHKLLAKLVGSVKKPARILIIGVGK